MDHSANTKLELSLESMKPLTALKESQIQTNIIKAFRRLKYTIWRSYVGPIVQTKKGSGKPIFLPNPMAGYPDLTGFLVTDPKQLFCIEVKSENGRLSAKQKDWFTLLQTHGVIVFVARTATEALKTIAKYEID